MDEVEHLTKIGEHEEQAISYDLKDLKIESDNADSRYFVCNFCKQFNLVRLEDIRNLKANIKKEKKTVHMEINKDLAIIFKKFCTNFGGYEGGIIAMLNSFQIKHDSC